MSKPTVELDALNAAVGKHVEIAFQDMYDMGDEVTVVAGKFTGEVDTWGKWTFDADTHEPEVTTRYYLFPEEITELYGANRRARQSDLAQCGKVRCKPNRFPELEQGLS